MLVRQTKHKDLFRFHSQRNSH